MAALGLCHFATEPGHESQLDALKLADLQKIGRMSDQRPLGVLALAIAQRTDVPLVLISRRPARSLAGLSTPHFRLP